MEDGIRTHDQRNHNPRLEGRGPGTPGDALARQYLIDQLEALGLEPGGEGGSWEQEFPIIGIDATVPETWSFDHAGKNLDLAFWDDFIAASGVQQENAAVQDAEVVFVGYGIEAPEHQWDDFKGMPTSRGKVLLMLNNDPDWDADLFEGEPPAVLWPLDLQVRERGAAGGGGCHHHPHGPSRRVTPSRWSRPSWTGPQFELPAAGRAAASRSPPGPPTRPVTQKLVASWGASRSRPS